MARSTKPTDTTTKPEAKPVGSPPVTFDTNDPVFQKIVAEAVAVKLAAIEAEKPAKPAANGLSEISTKNDTAVYRACKKLGLKDIQPRVNVLTFRKWVEAGFRPKEKSRAMKINNLRLWHVSQVRPLTAEELAGTKAQPEAPAKRQDKAKVTQLHPAQ